MVVCRLADPALKCGGPVPDGTLTDFTQASCCWSAANVLKCWKHNDMCGLLYLRVAHVRREEVFVSMSMHVSAGYLRRRAGCGDRDGDGVEHWVPRMAHSEALTLGQTVAGARLVERVVAEAVTDANRPTTAAALLAE